MDARKTMVRATSKRAGRRYFQGFKKLRRVLPVGRKPEERQMTDNRDDGLEQRRKRLSDQLAVRHKGEAAEKVKEQQSEESRKGMALGLKISSEFIAAIAVGGMLGYLLDRFAGTVPWGMIIFVLLGFCAGVLNVLRAVGMVAKPKPFRASDSDDGNGA
jgi:ATP synthase protein I